MTQLKSARQNKITKEMQMVGDQEHIDPHKLMKLIAKGQVVITANKIHLQKNLKVIGVGKNLSTKVNVNLGASPHCKNIKNEIAKVKMAEKYGAYTIMDLSIGCDLDKVRIEIINYAKMPVGTVPIYQIADQYGILNFSKKDVLKVLEKQAEQGVDFFTIHAGFKKEFIPLSAKEKRLTGIVSRGGGILKKWMGYHQKENPFLQIFEEILDLMAKYDITMSLGDSLRPGCLHDANDVAQISELKFLGELTKKCWEKNVQVMIEGPGHVPIHMIQEQMILEKKYCHNAPFYVLGPLTIDSGAGYDHITGAIGAAQYGADMLCYVTPSEHLGLPNLNDVKEGLIAFKIAARSGDIAKGVPGALERENEYSGFRKNFNWGEMYQNSLDKEKFAKYRFESGYEGISCSMCGEKLCPMREE